jgi:hypothetical protein
MYCKQGVQNSLEQSYIVLIDHKKCLQGNKIRYPLDKTMIENLILPVATFAATILGLESAWRWLGNQEK